MVLIRETTGLNLSQCLRPDSQILISVRMNVGNKPNKYAYEVLSCFLWHRILLVQRCVLSGVAKNSQGYFLLSARPHPVFLVKSRGVVTFSDIYGAFVNDVTKCVCVLMIEVCIKCSEGHMVGFIGGILY